MILSPDAVESTVQVSVEPFALLFWNFTQAGSG
jgi:hypothetical protein